jgi:hypothetical protein
MVDRQGNVVEVPDEDAGAAFRSGQLGFEKGSRVPVVDELGTVGTIDADQAQQAFSVPELDTVSQDAYRAAEQENKYGGIGGEAASFGIGAADALTLGLGKGLAVEGAGVLGGKLAADRARETIRGYTETNPKSEFAGQVVGTAAPLLAGGVGAIRGVGGGVRAVDRLGGLAEAGVEALSGERAASLAGRVAQRAVALGARGAVEGAVYGAGGAYSDSRLANEDLTVERIMAGAGEGAITGAAIGGSLGAGIEVASTAIRKASNAAIGKLRAAADKANEAARTLEQKAGKALGDVAGEEGAAIAPKPAAAESKAAAALEGAADDVAGPSRFAPEALNDEKAFPRRTRYARGARDVMDPEFGDTDLPLGGRPGADTEIEELRRALVAEDLNSANRADKVKLLMNAIPEGAHPDWVMGMAPEQRAAMWNFVNPAADDFVVGARGIKDVADGGPEMLKDTPSEVTWRALADAVAEREGVKGWTPKGGAAAPVIELPKPSAAPERAAAAAAEPAAAEQAALSATPEPMAGEGSHEHNVFRDVVGRIVSWATGRGLAKAAGSLVGSTHGPVGYMAGGAVGAAVDKVLGKHVEAVNERITDAVTKFLGKGAPKSPLPSAEGLPGKTAGAVATIFGDKQPSPRAAPRALDAHYAQAVTAVAHLATNPAAHFEETSKLAPLAKHAPVIATKIAVKQGQAVKFLQSKLPPQTIATPLSAARPTVIGDMEKASFLRSLKAVQRPLSVLEDMKDGQLSKEGVEALKAVWPETYDDLRTKVLDRVAEMQTEGKGPSYQQRLQIGQLFDAAVDPTQRPEVVAAVQSLYDEMGNVSAPEQSGTSPGAAPRNNVDTAGSHETLTQRLEGREG